MKYGFIMEDMGEQTSITLDASWLARAAEITLNAALAPSGGSCLKFPSERKR